MKSNSKYIFVTLEDRNGEYEYLHRTVFEIPDGIWRSANRTAEWHARTFYPFAKPPDEEDGGYYFYGGEVFVEVDSWRFITREEYEVLKKYL